MSTSNLAFAAVLTGLIGMCFPFPFGLVAIGLGIAVLVKIRNNPELPGKGVAIVGMALPVVWMAILAGIGLLNRGTFQAMSRQDECRASLQTIYAAEQSFYDARDYYSTNIGDLGLILPSGNRYAYFLLDSGQLQDRSGDRARDDWDVTGFGVDIVQHPDASPISYDDLPGVAGGEKAGVHGRCPECSFVAVCAGNVDKDETLDMWSISSEDRTGTKGKVIPAGQPYNDVNDVTQ